MELLDAPGAGRAWSDTHRRDGRTVALVPTMGALHRGHLALIDAAQQLADVVAVSIFVNPLQFDRSDDFEHYPRPLAEDLEICARAGVAAVYAPTPAAMYPAGFQTHVEPGPLADTLEGLMRPGHFGGVATVVAKLFGALRPDVALFGEKDAQQLAVVRRMTLDLDLGVTVIGVPTVREPDGLALSSRNVRLSPDDRRAAVCVPRAIDAARNSVASGERTADAVARAARDVVNDEPRARLEYAEVVDDGFAPVVHLDDQALLVLAVWFGDVRLIDNAHLRV
jgi:pantoate--beta-alanine ligase